MAYYVKKNGQLEKIAGNVSISQADWNETDDRKITKIKNQPETLKTLDAVVENSNENALVGANAMKELTTTVAGMGSELIKTSAKVNLLANSDLGINVVEKGENIHLNDSANNKLVEFGLYGKAVQNTTTGKNLLPYPYDEKTHTESGVTWTDNNGIVTTKGTAIAMNDFLFISSSTPKLLKKGTYILSGCPSGGELDKTYFLLLGKVVDGQASRIASDTGNGATFTLEEDTTIYLVARFIGGTNADGLIFKPMIRLASNTDATYEPYTGGQPSPRPDCPQDIVVSGESYNLIPYPYEITTKTVNGITWTDLGDGRIMANGTATETSSFDKFLGNQTEGLREKLQSYGKVILTGCPSGGGSSTFRLFVWGAYNEGEDSANDYGSGATFTFDNNDKGFGFSAQIMKGVKVENLIFKPMLRKASVKNDRYMLYGKNSVEVSSLGKNYYDINKTTSNSSALLMDISGNSIRLHNTSEATFVGTKFVLDPTKIKIGKTYTFSADVKYTSGSGRLVLRTKSGSIKSGTSIIKTSGKYSFTFVMQEIGDYLTLFCTGSTAELGDVTYSNIQLEEGGNITEYETYKETISTIPTENGLAGIPVDSGGNYTDSNGQQWICDEIVKYADGSGEYVQRIEKKVFDGVNNVCTWVSGSVNNGTLRQMNLGNKASMPNSVFIESKYILCDKFKPFRFVNVNDNFAYGCRQGSTSSICCLLKESDGVTDIPSANEWLKKNNVKVYYIIEPIRTPLTKEQIAEIEKIKTFYPVTNISNDFDCGMKVKYIADNKAYVDKNLELQMKAQEESLMSMFMLLPDSVQAAMIENDTNNLLKESGV